MAFDTIMVFQDKFKNHILPDKVHMLSVAFLVPELRREFGGCAGNIAYNLKMLGEEPLMMATVGQDFGPYQQWLDKFAIRTDYVTVLEDQYTAQAYITTDEDDNQITAFHPGAMNEAHLNVIAAVEEPLQVGIVSPDGKVGMQQHAEQFVEAGIEFIFDPGQGLPMFDGAELNVFIDQASWVTVNDYEAQLMQERTGLTLEAIAEQVKALIVTQGGEGSTIYTDGDVITIPAASVGELQDPTGCGDAYRAGLLYGLMNDLDWAITGRIASLLGAIKIEQKGTQNHRFTLAEFKARYEDSFGHSF
jgi:adenosine kinase